ncbi:MAG: excinuclease ABC subunit UvrA, partial [Gammaproteobacteria bacterium]|nr:excinuclease ABC subunit UvrA [Gammaproteobacteria bacterium]
ISIEQKSSSHNPRSTVGTVTEIYDYLRLLYARVGTPRCPEHSNELAAMSLSDMTTKILSEYHENNIAVLAPIVKKQKGEHVKLIQSFAQQGYRRVRVNNEIVEISDISKHLLQHLINPKKKYDIELVVDRLNINNDNKLRITESLETASNISNGIVYILDMSKDQVQDIFSTKYSCPHCGYSISELEPKLFSFNSPAGACVACDGLGVREYFDPHKIIVNQELSLINGAIYGWDDKSAYYSLLLKSLSAHYKVNLDLEYRKLPDSFKDILFYGSKKEVIKMKYVRGYRKRDQSDFIIKEEIWDGIVKKYEKQYENGSYSTRERLSKYLSTNKCSECGNTRLNEKSRNIFISDKAISDITAFTTEECFNFFSNLKLKGMKKEISIKIVAEITSRLGFLVNVGLNYLSLDRSAETLSGGEAQRIRLASQIGSGLVGVMYILDEPSIGLHQKDNVKLINALKRLRDLGNTVIVIEHDTETMENADHIVDMGPEAGTNGGQITAQGTYEEIKKNKNSITGQYLSNKKIIEIPKNRRLAKNGRFIEISGASGNNLNNVNLKIPTGSFTCVTGVSGSGKSTLILQTLYHALNLTLNNKARKVPKAFKAYKGVELIDKIIDIDQSPIGRTPRSNPATYTGAFGPIRDCFTSLPESKTRGYKPGRFSFNVKGGRCEACEGDGVITYEMHFLPDVYIQCDE